MILCGYIFVSWDPNSLASLKKHYKDIDLLIPEQLHAVSADGALTIVDTSAANTLQKTTPGESYIDIERRQAAPVDENPSILRSSYP